MLARFVFVSMMVRAHLFSWLVVVCATTVVYYGLLMLAPIVKFGQWPNYANTYNWFSNVHLILISTPSWIDIAMIVKDEWVLEVGYMNYDFGVGLSQWSVFIAPIKVFGIVCLGALLATLVVLVSKRDRQCRRAALRGNQIVGGVGASLVALASVTLSWVVCCSTPTWVVGLAMMGLGVSTSLWLEPLGVWLNVTGFSLLVAAIFMASADTQAPLTNQ